MNKQHNEMGMKSVNAGVGRRSAAAASGAAFAEHGGTRRITSNLRRIVLMTVLFLVASLASAFAAAVDGDLIYNINTTTPQSRAYTNSSNTFGAAVATLAGAIPSFIVNKASPTRSNERLVGYVTTTGVLYIYRWNGTAWTNETSAAGGWGATVTVGGDGVNGRRFDIEYENTSGDAIVVYSNNTAGTSELRYRIWNGTSWTAATTLDSARITGIPAWVKLRSRKTAGSDEIALLVAGEGTATANTAQLSTLIWSGTAWGNEPATAHSTVIPSQAATPNSIQNDCFDLAYEGLSGDLLVVWTNGGTAQQYWRSYSAGTWSAATSYATGRTAPLQMVAVGNPYSNEILVAFNRSASATLYANMWSGTGVGTTTSVATNATTTAINKKHIAANWVRSGTTDAAVLVYTTAAATAQGVSYNTYTGGAWGTAVTWASGVTVTSTNAAWNDLDADMDTTNGSNELMLTFSDGQSDLWAKRLIFTAPNTFAWSNADGGTALTAVLTAVTAQNFDFSYDYLIDNGTPPVEGTLSVTPEFGSAFVDSPMTVTETFTESQTQLSSCEYTLDGSTWSAGAVSGSRPNFTCTASNVAVADGTALTIKMRATSKGGTSTPTNTLTRTVDSAAPTTSDNYPGGSVATDINVNLAVTDGTGSGVVSTKWCQDTTNACVPATTGLGPVSFTGAAGAKTVAYLRYFSTDNLGNVETTRSQTITIDKRDGTETLGILFSKVTSRSMQVQVLFGGDYNTNNTCTLTWGTDGVAYPNTATVTRSGSKYIADIASLAQNTTYYFRAQFGDANGVTGTNPLTASQTTTVNQLMHSSTVTGSKYGTWGTAFTCSTCHTDTNTTTNIKRIDTTVQAAGQAYNTRPLVNTGAAGSASAGWADLATTNKVCDVCHTSTKVFKYNTLDAATGNILTAASPPHPNDLDCIKCHLHRNGFKVSAGCTDCHAALLTWNSETYGTYQLNTTAPVVFAPNGTALRGENYGGHLLSKSSDNLAGLTTKAAWDAQCLMCHDGHGKPPLTGVDIPIPATAELQTALGIGYKSGHIALGGSATSGSTEAEICWNCHDAVGVSEWGVNNNANTGSMAYNYGSVTTSNWTTATWSSGKGAYFAYKTGAIQSTHSANESGTSTVTAGNASGYGRTETVDSVANIRCSYCHDVHNTANLGGTVAGDVNGKPYLRGTWKGNPYPEDGAPRTGWANWARPGVGTDYGIVPRGSASRTNTGVTGVANLGGYWIDQNTDNPNSGLTATQTSGLCDLCHGAAGGKNGTWTATELGAIDWNKTANDGGTTASNYALWVSGYNGHANVVLGGPGRGAAASAESYARNVFTRAKRGTTARDAGGTYPADAVDMGLATQATNTEGYAYRSNSSGDGFNLYPRIGGATPTGTGTTEPYGHQNFAWSATYRSTVAAAHLRSAGTAELEIGGMTAVNDVAQTEATNYDSQPNYHTFNCGKCHNPHASRLPKLMITNCLDTNHNNWDNDYTGPGTNASVLAVWQNSRLSQYPSAQNCHRLDDRATVASPVTTRGKGWNEVTPWNEFTAP